MPRLVRATVRMLLSALVVLASSGLALAVPVPALRARVNDDAGILDPSAEAALEAKLERYERETGHQFALLTVPSLEGESVDAYAVRAFEAWKLGDARRDDGLLVVVALRDRAVRIEVGYGLEGAIPDAIAARVIRNVIVPAFRSGDYAGGLDRAFDVLAAAARGEAVGPALAPGERVHERIPPLAVFWVLIVLLWVFSRGRRGGLFWLGGPGGFFVGGHRGGFGGGGFGGGGGFHGGGGRSGGGGASGGW